MGAFHVDSGDPHHELPDHNLMKRGHTFHHMTSQPIEEQASVGDCCVFLKRPQHGGPRPGQPWFSCKCPGYLSVFRGASGITRHLRLSQPSGFCAISLGALLSNERDLFRVCFSPRVHLRIWKCTSTGFVCTGTQEVLLSSAGSVLFWIIRPHGRRRSCHHTASFLEHRNTQAGWAWTCTSVRCDTSQS